MKIDEKDYQGIINRGHDLEGGINRSWEEKNHYGEIVDRMMDVDFKEFPKEQIIAAAILTDLSEQNKLTLSQLDEIDLDKETFDKIRTTQAEHRSKIRNKLLDIIKIDDADMDRFRSSEGEGCENENEFLTKMSVAYKIQKRVYFMRNGKDLGPYSRSDKMNKEFEEATEAYVDANSVRSMEFFESVFGDDNESQESEEKKVEEYEVPTGIGTFTVKGKNPDEFVNEKEEIKEAEGWLFVKAVKKGNYEGADFINKEGVELNDEMKETLNALKLRAIKESDNQKVEYIDKVLNN
jgi:hypothetical protein